MDRNSTRNQDIKRKFVQREVLACITDWASQLFDDDDYYGWENVFVPVCPECGAVYSLGYATDGDNLVAYPYSCTCCGYRQGEPPHVERAEILEYWIVSPWLGEKLKAHGEAVLERYHGWVWGRQATGQAILLDDVISDICMDLRLLKEGYEE